MLNFVHCYFQINKKLVVMRIIIRLSLQCLFMLFQRLFISSQCVTLGSKYKNIWKLCNGQWIPVSATCMTIYRYWDNKRGIL
ncbi:WPE palindromic element domain-containing protein [Wolbachia endosymbiont of Rhagoletis cingulata]